MTGVIQQTVLSAKHTTSRKTSGGPPHRFTRTQANTAWGFATADVPAPELFASIAEAAPRTISQFNSQSLATLAWSFAREKVDAPDLYAAISTTAQQQIEQFAPRDHANVAWAYATAKHEDPKRQCLSFWIRRCER